MRTGRGITGAAGRQRVREAAAAVGSGRTMPIEMPRAKGSVLSAVRVRGEVVIDFWWRAVVTTLARRNIPARLSREVRPRCRDHRSPARLLYTVQSWFVLQSTFSFAGVRVRFRCLLETSYAIATTPAYISQHALHAPHLHLLRRRHALTRATKSREPRVPSHDTSRRRTE